MPMRRLALVLECDSGRHHHDDTRLYAQDHISMQFGLRVFGVGIIVHTTISGYPEDGIRDLSIVNPHQGHDLSLSIVSIVAAGKYLDLNIFSTIRQPSCAAFVFLYKIN